MHHGGHRVHRYLRTLYLITKLLLKRETGILAWIHEREIGTFDFFLSLMGDFLWDMFTWCMDFMGYMSDITSSEASCVGSLMLLGGGEER